MNLKVGETNYSNADLKIDLVTVNKYERAIIKDLSCKYYQDVDNALKTSLSNIGVSIESLRQGDLIMVPNSSYTDYFYNQIPLFRLHSIPNFLIYGGWRIEYFSKHEQQIKVN